MQEYTFQAQIRLRSNGKAPASRHFITVEKSVSEQISQRAMTKPRKGRWSVRVEVMIGYVRRKTSIFSDKNTWCFLLPIKATVRKDLQIGAWDEVNVVLKLLGEREIWS